MFLLNLILHLWVGFGASYLTIDKTTNEFKFNGNTVFLSGVNQPWVNYARDFGNNQPNGVFCALNSTIANTSQYGGNTIREWLFTDGSSIPEFDSNGNVIATDNAGTLIDDMKLYLQAAGEQNVFILFSLWNGATTIQNNLKGLITDESKLNTFITNVLQPMVKELSDFPSLAGWEIMNEPEGSVKAGESNSNPCFDTTKLSGTGAGWTNSNIEMSDLLKFINLQVSGIHDINPNALVTVGAWCEKSNTNEYNYFNYYNDTCLTSAGGKSNGILDFYQIHSYKFNGQWNPHAPFNSETYKNYNLDKPLVIGEFSSNNANESPQDMYNYAIDSNDGAYMGAWDWSSDASDGNDDIFDADKGMSSISNYSSTHVNLNAPTISGRCWCSDIPPDSQYTCEQQAGWGKCNQTWMQGYCCRSCDACQGCT